MGNVVILLVPVFLEISLEVHVNGKLRPGIQPDGAARQPVVRQLGLPAVFQLLLEDAVLVADGVAHCRVRLGGKGVHIAGGKTAQPSVAQTCVRLVFIDLIQVDVVLSQNLGDVVHQLQVVKTGFEGSAHQEFHGQIVDLLAAVGIAFIDKGLALCPQDIHHHGGQNLIDLLVRGLIRGNVELGLQTVDKLLLEIIRIFVVGHTMLRSPAPDNRNRCHCGQPQGLRRMLRRPYAPHYFYYTLIGGGFQ